MPRPALIASGTADGNCRRSNSNMAQPMAAPAARPPMWPPMEIPGTTTVRTRLITIKKPTEDPWL
jgi:hypothetical protein